ncbi:MAG: VCBS repeat-containing protein [candidate division WOR-3 bacterium]
MRGIAKHGADYAARRRWHQALSEGRIPAGEAEDLPAELYEPHPLAKAREYAMFTANLNAAPDLEIVLPHVILTSSGTVSSSEPAISRPRSLHLERGRPEILTCSGDTITFQRTRISRRLVLPNRVMEALMLDAHPLASNHAEAQLLTIEQVGQQLGRDGVLSHLTALVARDPETGNERWRYEFGASECRIWACADLNDDSVPELLLGTYGYEHGITINDVSDQGYGYVFAFTLYGDLLWRWTCGPGHYLFTRLLVADLDNDSRPEVVAACGSWRRDYGLLAILDGVTGRVRAVYPPTGPACTAFTGLAVADVNRDGQLQICVAGSGACAQVLVFQPGPGDQLTLLAQRDYPTAVREDFTNADIAALNDLDHDGETELFVALSSETRIDDDPYYYPSIMTDSRILILSPNLTERALIPLGSPPRQVILTNLGTSGRTGLLVLTDRLEYYEPR